MILCFYRNIDQSSYCQETKHDMLEILKANSQEEVQQIFEQIKMRDEVGISSKYIIYNFYLYLFIL